MSHAKILAVLAAAWFLAACTKAPPPPPAEPDAALKAMAQSLADKKVGELWHTLPPSYQKDVNDLVHEFAAKVDKEVYDKSLGAAGKLVNILKEKKDFILGHPMLAAGMVNLDEAKKSWDSVVGVLQIVLDSEVRSVDSLKTVDVGKFLASTGNRVMEKAAEISKLTPDDALGENLSKLGKIETEVVSSSETVARVKFTVPGEPSEEHDLVKIEGRWVPKDLVDEWAGMMQEAREALSALGPGENKAQTLMMLNMAHGALDGILAAKTQEEFNQVTSQLFGMMMGGGAPPGGPPTTETLLPPSEEEEPEEP